MVVVNSKSVIIQKGTDYLKEKGFAESDYCMSLQGPTVILTVTGEEKMSDEVREKLVKIGLTIL